jgi:hypothetical protein
MSHEVQVRIEKSPVKMFSQQRLFSDLAARARARAHTHTHTHTLLYHSSQVTKVATKNITNISC